ncbi:MAG TPA: hypothetical protein PLR99_28375 [Polyangiaceae bacterium]|nr:hypothetical protein [Polyangiaceae bacterium]
MAYLNLRDRRIEAKVAYVGPTAGGKATNLQQLSRLSGGLQVVAEGDTMSLSWQPVDTKRFRDCDVVVRVVTQRGAPSDDRLLELLREVDAVVLVADAEPGASGRNRECLAAVRRALAVGRRPRVSLVVQVNKTDLPDALGAQVVIEQLDAREVPHVVASALQGQGVVETLEAAVSDILAAMNEEITVEPTPDTVRPGGRAPAGATDGGHPLLTALRQILRDTTREQADAMATRVSERLEDAVSRVALQVVRVDAALGASAAAQRTTEEQLCGVAASLEEVTVSLAARATTEDLAVVASSVSRVRADVTARLTEALEKVSAADAARAESLAARLSAIEAAGQADRAHLADVVNGLTTAFHAWAHEQEEHLRALRAAVERGADLSVERSRADHERAAAKAQALEVVVREAARTNSAELAAATSTLASALDDRARAHREQLAAVAHALGKAVGQVSVDVNVDLRAGLGDVLARVDEVVKGLSGVAAQLTAGSGELRALGLRVDGAVAAATERAEAAAAGLREISASLSAGFAATDLSHRATQSRVAELIEELSKPKRGWFT